MASLNRTLINQDIDRPVVGYMINTLLDDESRKNIARLQADINRDFAGGVWHTPQNTLHITLMDWLAPLVDYGGDKQALFIKLFPEYDNALTSILKDYKRIKVHFEEIKVTNSAIIIIGQDDGQFNDIRRRFLQETGLLPGTKQPPDIIHSSVTRFVREMDVEPIAQFLALHSLDFSYEVESFRLVREDIAPQLKHKLLKEYALLN